LAGNYYLRGGDLLDKTFIPFAALQQAIFMARPNRFLVRCKLVDSSEVVEAHLADPGRLTELLLPGVILYVEHANNPNRKTKWSVILVKDNATGILVSVRSTLANQLAGQALQMQAISELSDWQFDRAEFTLGNSRLDFLLKNKIGEQKLVEVKSCTLVHNKVAMFPDAVTARGQKHVRELTNLQLNGDYSCAILFIVQRADAKFFRPADHIDPTFGQLLREAHKQGVLILAYKSIVTLSGIKLGGTLPLDLR